MYTNRYAQQVAAKQPRVIAKAKAIRVNTDMIAAVTSSGIIALILSLALRGLL